MEVDIVGKIVEKISDFYYKNVKYFKNL